MKSPFEKSLLAVTTNPCEFMPFLASKPAWVTMKITGNLS